MLEKTPCEVFMEQEKQAARERIDFLRNTLRYHAERYYVYDSPEISDYEYDMLYAELLRLEAEDPEYLTPPLLLSASAVSRSISSKR